MYNTSYPLSVRAFSGGKSPWYNCNGWLLMVKHQVTYLLLGKELQYSPWFRYPFHPRVTTVARKRSRVILPKAQVAGYSQTHMHTTHVASNKVTL